MIQESAEMAAPPAVPEPDPNCKNCAVQICLICEGKNCGWCPDCSPEVPEWD